MPTDDETRSLHAPSDDTAEVVPPPPSATSQDVDASGEELERNTMMSLVDLSLPPLDATRNEPRYDEGALLGSGGMGEVRLSHDRRIGRRVARKVLHLQLESAASRERFLREVRVQGQLEHPAIVPVYDLDVAPDGTIWFAMKRVRGVTLEHVLSQLSKGDDAMRKRFSTRRLLAAFAQVCHAIHYAHSRGVVHRDLKPANVMLGDFGEVYVLDWGLALVLTDPALPSGGSKPSPAMLRLTGGDTVVGTLAYMAPEQISRRHEGVDGRADVYALGVMLFEILTLKQLRPKATVGDVLRSSRQSTRPSEHADDVPPELDDLSARSMLPKREDRPRSARVVAEHVERYLDGDRDSTMRKDLAAHHAARANDLLGHAPKAASATERTELRVAALREATAALALDAESVEAQHALVETLGGGADDAPREAEDEIAALADRARSDGAKMGMIGLLVWLLTLPMAMAVGVLDWRSVGATAITTVVAAAFAGWLWKRPRFGLASAAVLATLVAAVVGLSSCYLGAFVVVPTCASMAGVFFSVHATRTERVVTGVLLALGAVAPDVLEWIGVVPRAYTFVAGGLVAHARGIALPEGPTRAAMLWSTSAFVIVSVWLVGRMRDSLARSERTLFLRAWTLRQLFASTTERAAAAASTTTS